MAAPSESSAATSSGEGNNPMFLAIDVGNTNVVLGIFNGETLEVSWRLTTLPARTSDELWVLVNRLFAEHGIDPKRFDGVALASVVPALTQTVTEMVARHIGRPILVAGADNAGLPIAYEQPGDVGADRLVNAVAALRRHAGGATGTARPIIVVDFGTATTFDVISARGEYLGGVICPGVEISADALFLRAARLPRVDVRKPAEVIGRSTVASMQSGLFYGYVAMVEGIVGRLHRELGDRPAPICVGTGGLAGAVAAETAVIDAVEPDLTLIGLRYVWEQRGDAGA